MTAMLNRFLNGSFSANIRHLYGYFVWHRIPGLILLPIWLAKKLPGVPLETPTFLWTLVYALLTGFAITTGYHRMWAHQSFRANVVLKIALAVFGAATVQMSIKWWVKRHRAHHRYIDTDRDPYNARKGLFHSHVGWIIVREETTGDVDISDLERDPVVIWQDQYYLPLAICMSVIFPTLVAGVGWQDWRGGFFWASLFRKVFVQHCTFLVNSLAHWAGDQPFSKENTSRDSWLTSILTLGEGYHNFHHQFPTDYRNGVRWYDCDPSKWMIWVFAQLGLATNLKRTSHSTIERHRRQSPADAGRTSENYSTDSSHQHPEIEWDDYVQLATKNGRALIAIAGFVHDVSDFLDRHPGGEVMLREAMGKDATIMFHGKGMGHSSAANHLLSTMRVYSIRAGGPVNIPGNGTDRDWKEK